MKLDKASKRDRKRDKAINGPREDGRSVFTIKQIQKNRAKKIEQARKRKEEVLNGDST